MTKKIILAIVGVILVLAALASIKATQIGTLIAMSKTAVPPAETVASAVVREEKWLETLPTVGSISAVQGVLLTAEVPGTVAKISFESGALVNQGDLLVSLDVSTEEAQLRSLAAQVEYAQTNLARFKSLRTENTVSQAELDQAETDLKQKQANADAIRATIAKKVIRAPFAGSLGIRQINPGQYLEAGKQIVSLQALAPVYGNFSLPQQELARLKTGLKVRVTTDTYPDQQFTGTLTAINPDLDPTTRSLRVQATFANAEQLLRPGMFTRMEVVFPEEHAVLVIPATSILRAPYSDSVYVITASTNAPGALEVHQQVVRLGRTHGDFVSVTAGLKPGDRVVTSGIFKLRNGMSVVENNNLTPTSERKPNPSDS